MARMFRSSKPDFAVSPRTQRETTYRYMSHGPIIPLEQPTLLERLLGMR